MQRPHSQYLRNPPNPPQRQIYENRRAENPAKLPPWTVHRRSRREYRRRRQSSRRTINQSSTEAETLYSGMDNIHILYIEQCILLRQCRLGGNIASRVENDILDQIYE